MKQSSPRELKDLILFLSGVSTRGMTFLNTEIIIFPRRYYYYYIFCAREAFSNAKQDMTNVYKKTHAYS